MKSNRAVELRSEFGRQKVAVMAKGKDDFYYISLYDNRSKYKGNIMFLGCDELDELIRIKETMHMFKAV